MTSPNLFGQNCVTLHPSLQRQPEIQGLNFPASIVHPYVLLGEEGFDTDMNQRIVSVTDAL